MTPRAPRVALLTLLLAGCAAAAPAPDGEDILSNAISGASGPENVIVVETEDELVEQLSILLEDTYYREAEFQAAYEEYLISEGEPPVVLAGAGAAACVAAGAARGGAAGAALGELAVDVCRWVGIRFSWSPIGWVSALVCTAIDRTNVDQAIGRAIGRTLGGAFARCSTSEFVSGTGGLARAPAIALPQAIARPEEETPPEEEPTPVPAPRPVPVYHPQVNECTVEDIDRLCDPGASGSPVGREMYHGPDACGPEITGLSLTDDFHFNNCERAIGALIGTGLDDRQMCEGALRLGQRAANCRRGREIVGLGCYGQIDDAHRIPRARADVLRSSCRAFIDDNCGQHRDIHSDDPSLDDSYHTNHYCPQPMM